MPRVGHPVDGNSLGSEQPGVLSFMPRAGQSLHHRAGADVFIVDVERLRGDLFKQRYEEMQRALSGALPEGHELDGRDDLVLRPRPCIGLQGFVLGDAPVGAGDSKHFGVAGMGSLSCDAELSQDASKRGAHVTILRTQLFGLTCRQQESAPAVQSIVIGNARSPVQPKQHR